MDNRQIDVQNSESSTEIDLRTSNILPSWDKVNLENYLSDHRPVFSLIDVPGEDLPLRCMSWNIQSGTSCCYQKIAMKISRIASEIKKYVLEDTSTDMNPETEEIYKGFFGEKKSDEIDKIKSTVNSKKWVFEVHDYIYKKRMARQVSLIPKDELDVICIQEATKEMLEIYKNTLGDDWNPVYKIKDKDIDIDNEEIFPVVTFINNKRVYLSDDEVKYEDENHDVNIKYCQTMRLKTINNTGNNTGIEFINYWGQDPYVGTQEGTPHEINQMEKARLNAIEQRLGQPLKTGDSLRIVGMDSNLKFPGDDITCIGMQAGQQSFQHDLILSSKGDGVIQNETLIKSKYRRNENGQHIIDLKGELIKNGVTNEHKGFLQKKIEMLESIGKQISRIEKTQTWFWLWFYKNGAQKIVVLEGLSACIFKSDDTVNLKNNISTFLSKVVTNDITNESILKRRRLFNLFEEAASYKAVEEIKNKLK